MTELEVVAKVKKKVIVSNPKLPIARILLVDGTGKAWMNLWREQVEQVNEGDTIHLKNAFTQKHKGRFFLNTWEKKIVILEDEQAGYV